MTNPMPPGWYDDPDGSPNAERRWDGRIWTPERRRKAAPSPASSYPPPPPTPSYPPAPSPSYSQPTQAPPTSYQSAPTPYPAPGPVQPSSYQQPAPPQYPQPPHFPPGPTQPNQAVASNLFSIIAFVCAGLAVLGGVVVTIAPLPFVFGVVAIICAVAALTKKERLAPFAIGAAVGGLILGWTLQAVFWNSVLY
jgi:hypothetical protein